MWTSHGHQIIGTTALDPVTSNRPRVGRCGGPSMCQMCATEAAQARKAKNLDEFGNPQEIVEGRPTVPGFYYIQGEEVIMYFLDQEKQWWTVLGKDVATIDWSPIEQLSKIKPLRRVGEW